MSYLFFSRLRSLINFPFFIHNISIRSIGNFIRDLGFTLTRNLSPVKHIEEVCCKALTVLGFILRPCSEFFLLSSFKALYYDRVHSIFVHENILWNPYTTCTCVVVEGVQRKFLRIATHRLISSTLPMITLQFYLS